MSLVPQELHNLFDWIPPPLSRHKDAKKLCPPLIVPSEAFYDKHIDERLTLKKIVKLPSLIQNLAENAQSRFNAFMDAGSLPSLEKGIYTLVNSDRRKTFTNEGKNMIDANTVATFYKTTMGNICQVPAGTVLHLPKLSTWGCLLLWRSLEYHEMPKYSAVREDFTLQIANDCRNVQLASSVKAELTDEQLTILDELWDRFPNLATWQILPFWKQSEDLIRSMCDLDRSRPFFHQQGGTKGSFGNPLPPPKIPRDASRPQCTIPFKSNSTGETLRRSSRLEKCVSRSKWSPTTVSSSTSKARQFSKADTFIQKAWCQAVESDSTFIVFTCGSLELIGIRHRATQTLYLSDIIDVQHCRNPGYGLVHIGLYVSIFEDAKDRLGQQLQLERESTVKEPSNTKKRKRRLNNTKSSRKRRKINQQERARGKEIVLREASCRSVALVQFRYSNYNSRSPSLLKRVATSLVPGVEHPPIVQDVPPRKCHPHDYISIVVSSWLGDGAVGVVHRATLEVALADTSTYTYDAVLKLAFSAEQRRKLHKEYAIYEHLARNNITSGIPTILGLFEEVDEDSSGPLIMVMSYGGINLYGAGTITNRQRDSLIATLDAVHQAGVLHNDIRYANILISETGRATIIDFDCARLVDDEHERLKEPELQLLKNILDVGEEEWRYLTPSSREPSLSRHWYSDEEDDEGT